MALNTISRSLHDVGLAAWFGGTLANAVALNAAAGETRRLSDAGGLSTLDGTAGHRSMPPRLARTCLGASGCCGGTRAGSARSRVSEVPQAQRTVGPATQVESGV